MPFLVQEPEDLGSPLSQVLRKLPSIAKSYLEKGEQRKAAEMGLYIHLRDTYKDATPEAIAIIEKHPLFLQLAERTGMPNKIPTSETSLAKREELKLKQGELGVEQEKVGILKETGLRAQATLEDKQKEDELKNKVELKKTIDTQLANTSDIDAVNKVINSPEYQKLSIDTELPPYNTQDLSREAKIAEIAKTEADIELSQFRTKDIYGDVVEVSLDNGNWIKRVYNKNTGKWEDLGKSYTQAEKSSVVKSPDPVTVYTPKFNPKGDIIGVTPVELDTNSPDFIGKMNSGNYYRVDNPLIQTWVKKEGIQAEGKEKRETKIESEYVDINTIAQKDSYKAITNLAKLDEMEKMLQIAPQGVFAPLTTTFLRYFSAVTGQSSKELVASQAATTIINAITLTLIGARNDGLPAGAFSDKDLAFLQNTNFNLTFDRATNLEILRLARIAEEVKIIKAKAYSKYYKEKGKYEGVDDYYRKSLDYYYSSNKKTGLEGLTDEQLKALHIQAGGK